MEAKYRPTSVGDILKRLKKQYPESDGADTTLTLKSLVANQDLVQKLTMNTPSQSPSPPVSSHLTTTPSSTNASQLHAPVEPNGEIVVEHNVGLTSSLEPVKNLAFPEIQQASTSISTSVQEAEEQEKTSRPAFSIDNLLAGPMNPLSSMEAYGTTISEKAEQPTFGHKGAVKNNINGNSAYGQTKNHLVINGTNDTASTSNHRLPPTHAVNGLAESKIIQKALLGAKQASGIKLKEVKKNSIQQPYMNGVTVNKQTGTPQTDGQEKRYRVNSFVNSATKILPASSEAVNQQNNEIDNDDSMPELIPMVPNVVRIVNQAVSLPLASAPKPTLINNRPNEKPEEKTPTFITETKLAGETKDTSETLSTVSLVIDEVSRVPNPSASGPPPKQVPVRQHNAFLNGQTLIPHGSRRTINPVTGAIKTFPDAPPSTPVSGDPPKFELKFEPQMIAPLLASRKVDAVLPKPVVPPKPVIKVPCPIEMKKQKERDEIWEKKKRDAERRHNKCIIWSRTVTYPPIDTFPPLPKKVIPTKPKPVPKEKPPVVVVVKPRPPVPDVLIDYSVDTIFLALIEEPNRCIPSLQLKPLQDLVEEKQKELDAILVQKEATPPVETTVPIEETPESEPTEIVKLPASPIISTPSDSSSNTGEDAHYAAQDLKKLEEEVRKEVVEFVAPVKPVVVQMQIEQPPTPKKKGRPKGSKKTKSASDTDTESLSEEPDEEEFEDFDIVKACKEIDDVHKKAKKRKYRNSDTFSEDNEGSSSSMDSRAGKRKSLPDKTEPAPKTRRSERLKNTTAKMEDFFYESAVTAQSEQTSLPESPRDEDMEVDENDPVVRNVKKPATDRSKSKTGSRRSSTVSSAEVANAPGPSNSKKTRNSFRPEYSRRVSSETVDSLLDQVMIPTAPRDVEILDYFKSPIVRRAIVNKNTLCYAISMVQLLLRVPQVYSIIRSHSHKDNITKRPECFLCTLGRVISERPHMDDCPEFIAILKSSWKNMESEEMHCVMEAMQHFFYRFDEEYMLDHPDYIGKLPTLCSPIRKFFEIELIFNYKCKRCSHSQLTPDKAIYISVDLTKKSNGTMQSMVDNMANPSDVTGMACTFCESESLTSTIRFTKLPEVLLYFVPRVRSKKREKDMTVVSVQQYLYLKDNYGVHKYALCAFLTHCGLSGNKGHYKSFEVDRSRDAQFNEFDDARVIINSKLSNDITIVLALFRKEDAVAKDEQTDMIFDGRGNIIFAHEKHCKQD